MTEKAKTSKTFDFPMIDLIERRLRRNKRNQLKSKNSDETETTTIEDEVFTTITIPQKNEKASKSILKKFALICFTWIQRFVLLLAIIGGLVNACRLCANQLYDDEVEVTDRYHVLILDKINMTYKFGKEN